MPDAATAIRIAEAVWKPIYGAKQIEKQRPFTAKLIGNIWHVKGSFRLNGRRGGTALAEISKVDGRILRVGHGK